MPETESRMAMTFDLDGVHFYAPWPRQTLFKLLKRQSLVPLPNRPIEDYQPGSSRLSSIRSKLAIASHACRPFKKDSLNTLAIYQQISQDYDLPMDLMVLSGRHKDLHPLTLSSLNKGGHLKYLANHYLNTGQSASAWKEHTVRRLLDVGYTHVIHHEDDLFAAIAVAQVNPHQVQVYLYRNLTNHPLLLKWASVDLLPNIVLVNNFKEAVRGFENQLVFEQTKPGAGT